MAFPTCYSEPICEAFLDRISKLSCLEGLPPMGSKGLQKLVDGRLEQILDLLDASHVPVKVWYPWLLHNDFVNGLTVDNCF